MALWRRLALSTYYHLTLPWRWRCAKRGSAPVCVLFYHRVSDTHSNPWTISNRQFVRQLNWLDQHFDLISLEEAQLRIQFGQRRRPAVAITFDDGYAENCEQALPLLIKRRIPFAYFVATDFVLRGRPFPHDAQHGVAAPPNTVEQIWTLAEAGAEIGAHTRTHLDLGKVENESMLRDEILGSAADLEEIIGRPVRYFAFPYGGHKNLTAEAFHLCREAGLAGVCSAYGGYNFAGDDAFHLQRIHGDPVMARLKNWLTVDPRKAATVKRFHYEPLAATKAGVVA